MTLMEPGVDLAGFLAAVVAWMGPTFYVLVSMAVALEVVWIGAKWWQSHNG